MTNLHLMKKVIVFLTLILVLLCSCGQKNEGWQKVSIENVGTIEIPGEWSFSFEDDLLYIFDENSTPVIIQLKSETEEVSDKYHDNYKYNGSITNPVLSNSAIYGKCEIMYENVEIERLYISLPMEGWEQPDFELIFWDTEIDTDMQERIAKTFVLAGTEK